MQKTEQLSERAAGRRGRSGLRGLSLAFSSRTAPVLLLLVTALGFGLLIPWLGFYWDDWAKTLVSRVWGLGAYFDYYAEDRPLSAWTHIALIPLLGSRPAAWHVFTLLLRWLSAWGMWWSLNGIWPAARRPNLVAALLFVVYPVFVQQAAAVTFHQQWLQYALFFLSLGAMVAAWNRPDRARKAFWGLTALALAAAALQLSVTEYFAPLELARPAALWFVFARLEPGGGGGRRLGKTLRAWAPYLALLAAYTLWRLFLIRLPGEDPYRANTLYAFLDQPLATLRALWDVVLVDLARILVTSWADLFYPRLTGLAPFDLLTWALGLLACALVVVYLLRMDGGSHDADSPADPGAGWARQAALLGLWALLLGPAPAWVTGRQVVFDFHSDRYAMPAMFGAALLVAAGIEWLAQRPLQRAVLAGTLVALALGLHLRVANDYRWIWTDQVRFFWQLYWRAPGLKAPTAIFLEEEPFPNQGLFSTSAALNLLYPQPDSARSPDPYLGYWVYTLRPRYSGKPDSYTIGLRTQFRTLKFAGSTPDSLLFYKNPSRGNCLWLLEARDAAHPYLPELVKSFLPISNPGRILAEPPAPGYPPEDLFGREPAHTWCYFFQKASLARQQGDWAAVARLADEALARGYHPGAPGADSPYEWLPVIEGLARVGRWEDAAGLTRQANERDSHYGAMLCDLWSEGLSDHPGAGEARPVIDEVLRDLGCGNP